jgi:hypothetical protein
MKPKELRIGNYVLIRDYLLIVSGLTWDETEGTYEVVYHNNRASQPIKNFKPVPLTEHWILKFGFKPKYEDQEDNLIYEKNNLLITKDKFKEEFYLELNMSVESELKYVHQLQNLYFVLTADELEWI